MAKFYKKFNYVGPKKNLELSQSFFKGKKFINFFKFKPNNFFFFFFFFQVSWFVITASDRGMWLEEELFTDYSIIFLSTRP